MDHEGTKKIARAASIVSAATMLSRVLGYLRDMIIAKLFGAGMSTDAFFVAFRIPNMLRELFGEGALSASFVPIFTECLTQKGHRTAWNLARKAFTLLGLILLIVSGLGVLFAPLIVRVLAPGFSALPEKVQLTILLTRFMFPYIFFTGLAALMMGILNALGHFAAPALSPVMLNLAMIASALLLAHRLWEPILALAVGVLLGGVGQLLIQLPVLLRKGVSLKPCFDFADRTLFRVGRLMAPGVAGLAITQINVFIGMLLASFLAEGSVSYLYYAFRLVQLPIGLFGVALATAVLPTLSQNVATRSLEELKETFTFALRLAFFVSFPAMLIFLVFRLPIVHLLFERGEFSRTMTLETAKVLFFYAVGIGFYVLNRIIVPVYYSLQDTKTPVLIGAASVLANIVFSLLLMPYLRAAGLALATALASSVNFSLLLIALRRKLGSLHGRELSASFLRVGVCSLPIVLLGIAALQYQDPFLQMGVLGKAILLGGELGGSLYLFLLSARLLKCRELRWLSEAVGCPRPWKIFS